MSEILFVNCCVRDGSRTKRLAEYVLKKMGGNSEEVNISLSDLRPLDKALLEKRNDDIARGDYSNRMYDQARLFSSADNIVIAAPYWDLSFPSCLKVYIENISVLGLTFEYGTDGKPKGLCKANRFIYVTTSGGRIGEYNLGYDYIHALFTGLFGFEKGIFIKAEELDIDGKDPELILKSAMNDVDRIIL